MKLIVGMIVWSLSLNAQAADTCSYSELWSLPAWFSPGRSLVRPLAVSCRLNPFYLSGDFDGDGRQDVAVLISNHVKDKYGVAIVQRANNQVTILGAGVPYQGDDDFRWLDIWRVESKTRELNAQKQPIPNYRGDVLYLEKSESASGWVGMVGDDLVWYQGGD
ncbi:MAG: hypothetical protein HKN50_10440 [Gammaproteobacteria bacterium]|nr:hypothetical protein [Gammaproteobacteria bacterium]